MFHNNSRYIDNETIIETDAEGRPIPAIKLRRIRNLNGVETKIQGNTRLDLLAKERYDDATMFWHIADANTELDSTTLTQEPGKTVKVPEL